MNKKPTLSIVTPTRGDFSDYWLDMLLKVKGDIEFILVYPPEESVKKIDDPRVKILTSPFKGECIQRSIGLLNATGKYVWLINPFKRRKDQCGIHMENSINRVWKSSVIKESLPFLIKQFNVLGPLKWIPFWSLDRLMGLLIQAVNYKEGIKIGHWVVSDGVQVKRGSNESKKNGYRYIWPSDMLLAKAFPRYGYFWNLFFEQFWGAIKMLIHKVFSFNRGRQ